MTESARAPHARPRFKPYPAYKDSGVEWLGEIPAGWEAKRLKNCVQRLESGGTPESDNFEYWTDDESGIPWVAISDMTRSFHVRDTAKRLTERGLRSKRLPVLPAGTLLYSMYASLGKVALLEIDAVVNQAILGLVTRDELVSRDYLRWWLEFMQGHVQLLSSSNTQDNLNADKVRKMPVFVPGSVAQRAIAAFLDRETARIDALVAKKERLIGLLQEQRTALISRAVTKGLDPTVPMKDSGVEWLGEIPAHWEVRPFTKYVVEKSDYRGKTPEKVASGVFLVTARNVRMGLIDYDCSQEFIAEEDYDVVMRRGVPRKGDVLFTTEAPLGNVALVDREGIALAQRIIRFRMNPDHFDSRFTLFAMMSDYFQVQLLTLSTGSTAEGLKASKLPMLWLVAPPVTEQYAIAAFLDRETARIDALVAKVRDAIERLKELRTALISAAVTGKIDVREEVA